MNDDYEKRLEATMDFELKRLPELTAPTTLLPRVLAEIGRSQRALPWYRRAWATWPIGLQVGSFSLLAGLFAALCFNAGTLWHTAAGGDTMESVRNGLSGFEAAWGLLGVLGRSAVLVVNKMGPLFWVACTISGLAAYFSCLGLGTAFVRLAVVGRRSGDPT